MRPIRTYTIVIAGVVAVAIAVAGCTGSTASTAPSDAPAPTETGLAATAQPATATRIAVQLSDTLTIEPGAMTVPSGVPVTFVVTNAGTVAHEFVLGDESEQAAHEDEMSDAGGMGMPADEPMAIGVEPGMTKELTTTFAAPGTIIAGCHVAGHYAAGMQATITIE